MNYEGKLYGKVGGRYFDTGKTARDWDNLEDENSKLVDENSRLHFAMKMKVADKKSIINRIESILGEAIMECEEVDVTAEKIYIAFIHPLRLALQGTNKQ